MSCRSFTGRHLLIWLILLCNHGAVRGSASSATEKTGNKSSARACWQWYKSMLSERPLLTKSTTSAVIMSLSDVLCQRVEAVMQHHPGQLQPMQKRLLGSRLDWERTVQVAITGFTWSGPVSHLWYAMLEAVVRVRHAALGVAIRIVLDAAFFSPVAVAGYFTWRTVLDGKGVHAIISKLESKWQGAVVKSWQFWPIANIVNFGFVPVHFRVLYNNMMSMLWNGYMSHVNTKSQDDIINTE